VAQSWLLVHTAIAIVGIVVVITWLRIPPVMALLLGAVYLGVAGGLGLGGTAEALGAGFADVMGEIGLLVTFGVILGSLLTATSTLQRVNEALLRVFGVKRVPMVFAVTLSTVFTSIYSDVLLVLTAPLARRLGGRLGPRGPALMGGALTAGIEVGLVFVVPGVAAVAIAGVLGVPLGQMLLFGLVVGVPTAVLTMVLFRLMLPRLIRWDPAVDELAEPSVDDGASRDEPATAGGAPARTDLDVVGVRPETRRLPLAVAVAPILVSLVLIALGAVADTAGWESDVLAFFGDPVVAMFLGAGSAYLVARRMLSNAELSGAVNSALTTCGPILVLSGMSGSLAMVISESGLADVLGAAFSSGFLPPLLLVWLVAAILHVALGSISTAAIAAAGILAPIAGSLGVPTVLVALAAGSGALFVPHVSSNFFWMFQSLFGFSTRGTFKTHSVAMTLASVVSLPLVLALDLVV
jgi:gluconate:H+ symporter, GntP family